jgi:hypothetical protein
MHSPEIRNGSHRFQLRLVDETQVSELTGIPIKTLQNWRVLRKGPAFLKCGRLVRYEIPALERWLAASTIATDEAPEVR